MSQELKCWYMLLFADTLHPKPHVMKRRWIWIWPNFHICSSLGIVARWKDGEVRCVGSPETVVLDRDPASCHCFRHWTANVLQGGNTGVKGLFFGDSITCTDPCYLGTNVMPWGCKGLVTFTQFECVL